MLAPKRNRWSCIFCVLVGLAFAGCGENPHITGGDDAGAPPSSTDASQTAPAVEPPAPDTSAPPVPAGTPGVDGKDGRDGRDGACGDRPTTLDGVVKGLDHEALAATRATGGDGLPYLLKKGAPKLSLLSLDDHNAGTNANPYVKDAMILFNVEILLPPRRFVRTDRPLTATLSLSLFKRLAANESAYKDTEVLCLLDEQLCSGRMFREKAYAKLVNPVFGRKSSGGSGSPRPIVNDYFGRMIGQAIEDGGARVGGHREYKGTVGLDLAELLLPDATPGEASAKALLDLVYGTAVHADQVVSRTLRFIVADDVLVGSGERGTALSIHYVHDECKEAEGRSP